jgi:integrase
VKQPKKTTTRVEVKVLEPDGANGEQRKPRTNERRRRRHEGTIYQKSYADGSRRWVGAISLGLSNGRRRRRYVFGDSPQAVRKALDDLRRDGSAGLLADPGNLRVKDLVERYLTASERSVRGTTGANYATTLHRHVLPYLGGIKLRALLPLHLLDWLQAMEKAGVKPRAMQGAYDCLRCCLAFGVESQLLDHNAAERVKRPKLAKRKPKGLSAEDARRLLLTAGEGPAWVEAAVSLSLCGLRRGELFGLCWRHIDLGAGRIRVEQSLSETAGSKAREVKSARSIGAPKSESARRELALPAFALSALRRHREGLAAIPHGTALVFQTETGSPVRFSNFDRRHLKPLVKRAGLAGRFTLHIGRHTAATLALGGGADIKTAQAMMGHAKASHTLDLYADAIPGHVDRAMHALGDALSGAGANR